MIIFWALNSEMQRLLSPLAEWWQMKQGEECRFTLYNNMFDGILPFHWLPAGFGGQSEITSTPQTLRKVIIKHAANTIALYVNFELNILIFVHLACLKSLFGV